MQQMRTAGWEVSEGKPVHVPVNAVMPGRRNNPADHKNGFRPLAVYGPIHYQELPELFMDFVASLTGKSPSTTGAGSEGALTKGPFNALVPTTDLNNALLSYILTGYNGFTTAAGHIGPRYRVEHDISLLMPELWSRLSSEERDPRWLIKQGYSEKVEDFEYEGRTIPASRLGYRATKEFAVNYFGRIFDSPSLVFSEEMLKPELQSLEDFVDGIDNIVEAQQRVARQYIEDGCIEAAIPPLKALLYIMAEGSWEGMNADDSDFRRLFDRESVLNSRWYLDRLEAYREREAAFLRDEIEYIEAVVRSEGAETLEEGVNLDVSLDYCRKELERIRTKEYLDSLYGTLGKDILFKS